VTKKEKKDRKKSEPSGIEAESVTVEDASAAIDSAADESPETAAEADQKEGGEEQPEQDWHDRYLRLAAEFDNFRKRSAREFGSLVQNAERELIAELTEVLDNLGRAADSDHKGESIKDFAQGVALIRDQLWKTLEGRGLERMETVGQAFDPESHDALMRTPSEEYDEGVVAQEIAPGYRLNGKVLRHAQVVVSQGEIGAEDD
jgi:molecular chaperone GrpE